MLEFVVIFLLLGLVVFPMVTLIHELGHAIPTLILTDRVSLVRVGGGPWLLFRFRIGQLDLEWRPLLWFLGSAYPVGVVDRRSVLWMTAGDFIASLLNVIALFVLSQFVGPGQTVASALLTWALLMATIGLLITGPPVRYGRWQHEDYGPASDGYWLREWLRHPEWRDFDFREVTALEGGAPE